MADLELTLRDLARTGASATATAGLALLVLALGAELMRRRHAESALLRVADRFVPTPVQRVAAGILTLIATATSFALPSVASADTSLRGWLESPSVPSTMVTPATSSPPVQPSVKPSEPATDRPPAPSTRNRARPSAAGLTTPAPPSPANTAPAPEAPQASMQAPVVHRRSPAGPPPASARAARKLPTATAPPTPVAPPTQTPTEPVAASSTRPTDASARYVVVAGDCLWDIAARLIGPGASNAAIDHGWRAINAANRTAIGDDPGLIHPGLALTIPAFDPAP